MTATSLPPRLLPSRLHGRRELGAAVVVVVALLGGCSPGGTAIETPGGSATARPTSSPSIPPAAPTATATPNPAPTVAPTAVAPTPIHTLPPSGSACLLPVQGEQVGRWVPPEAHSAGFVDLDTLRYVADPASAFHEVDGFWYTDATPVLRGGLQGFSYDAAAHRWVPTGLHLVEPGGARYAYLGNDSGDPGNPPDYHVRIVDVATGSERDFALGGPYEPVAFAAEGLYVTFHQPETDGSAGLWLVDVDTGAKQEVTAARGHAWEIAGRFAWSDDKYQDAVLRLDLRTGRVTRWYEVSEGGLDVVAVTSTHVPLISAWEGGREDRIVVVPRPGAGKSIHRGRPYAVHSGYATVGAYLWMGADHDLFRYAEGKLSLVRFTPSLIHTVVVGGCR